MVRKHKARLLVGGSKETEWQENNLSNVAHHFIIILTQCSAIQQSWLFWQLEFEKALPDGHLARPGSAELPKPLFLDCEKKGQLRKWQRKPYG